MGMNPRVRCAAYEHSTPQLGMPELVVNAMLPFKYFRLTTWNKAAAASAGSGRYPTSSIYPDVGIDRPILRLLDGGYFEVLPPVS